MNGNVSTRTGGGPLDLLVAPYRETDKVPDPARPGQTGTLVIAGQPRKYQSFVHIGSHLTAAYCTSPFARRGERALDSPSPGTVRSPS